MKTHQKLLVCCLPAACLLHACCLWHFRHKACYRYSYQFYFYRNLILEKMTWWGFEPQTFQFRVGCSNHWATRPGPLELVKKQYLYLHQVRNNTRKLWNKDLFERFQSTFSFKVWNEALAWGTVGNRDLDWIKGGDNRDGTHQYQRENEYKRDFKVSEANYKWTFSVKRWVISYRT